MHTYIHIHTYVVTYIFNVPWSWNLFGLKRRCQTKYGIRLPVVFITDYVIILQLHALFKDLSMNTLLAFFISFCIFC